MSTELFHKKLTVNCKGKLLELDKPVVMGILNLTPDSFYDGGKHSDIESIKRYIRQLLSEGASIIDIGAYSSRPGAQHINEKEEIQRLEPVLRLLLNNFPDALISLDTFRSGVAKWAVNDFGVAIINDISGGQLDDNMFDTIAKLSIPYILMHMQGTPQNMQKKPEYTDVIGEIIDYFSEKMLRLRSLGVHDIILDPGFGFGKTIDHNYQILNNLHAFRIFELPVLAGLSRKSMIYKFLDCTAEDALNGTSVLNTIALSKGASIIRAHDVKEAKQAIDLYRKTIESVQ